MENIATFLHALSKIPSFRSFDLFSTVDLYEGKNMASVARCILSCKRIAEKELLSRGIKTLKDEVEAKSEDIQIEDEPTEEFIESENENVHEVESFEEIQEVEKVQNSEDFEFEIVEQVDTLPIEETIEPEIVLVDSPVFADDESGPIIRDNYGSNEEFEEYETFTMENPGTFEIRVTDQ